ncbi:membrane protein [Streptomyces sp. CT34]|uniref:membrane protein n=1 Tax=Streptomyces sp. CT34 TaxID=1553907 RepID=UPI0005BBB374|nr:membrane protein [Streptomyces sp. CT34]
MATHDRDLKKELDATLQTRKELGPEYESELVESFLEKLDQNVDRRVRRQLAEQQMQVARGVQPRRTDAGAEFWQRFAVAVVSLVLAIPLSAIAVAQAGLVGLVVCWAGVVGVNAVHGLGMPQLLKGRAQRRDGDWD